MRVDGRWTVGTGIADGTHVSFVTVPTKTIITYFYELRFPKSMNLKLIKYYMYIILCLVKQRNISVSSMHF